MKVERYRVAVVQAAPPYPPSRKASLERACRLIMEAAADEARIVVLPEAYIPAYPNWAIEAKPPTSWDRKWRRIMEESMEIPGPETDRLCEAARKAGSMVCIGVNERDRLHKGSIYNTLLFISHEGILLGKHRKLTPAYREKVFWTPGSPEDLRIVYETPFGRVGGLICAEHLNPLLKSAMIIQAEQIHIACYPGWSLLPREIMDVSIRQYALECQCYVLAASQYLSGRPESSSDDEANWEFYGGSGVVDPTGRYLTGPSYNKEEILYAEIDVAKIAERKAWIDVAGKDARWDVIPFLQTLRDA